MEPGRADVAVAGGGREVLLQRDVHRVREPWAQARVAAAGGPLAAGDVDADVHAGGELVHARARHLPGQAQAQHGLGQEFEPQVQARQGHRVVDAVGDPAARRVALEGGIAQRRLVDVDLLHADVAAQRHAAELGIDVGLDVYRRLLFLDLPVLGRDVLVVVVDEVVEARIQDRVGIVHAEPADAAEVEVLDAAGEGRGHAEAAAAAVGEAQRLDEPCPWCLCCTAPVDRARNPRRSCGWRSAHCADRSLT